MGKDTAGPDRHWKDEGLDARTRATPTLGSYLSSALHLLALPALVVAGFVGHWLGYYPYRTIPLVLGGLLVGLAVAVFAVMHVTTSR